MNPNKTTQDEEPECASITHPLDGMEEFMSCMEKLGRDVQGIKHSEWWKDPSFDG